ncbi:MAG TPA: glycosyltransferase [Candidatus Bathyarchaeia archaeon]|nr:glycosyltransferase [Candidatus Bathyarchaeia archaeon]
MSLNDASIVTTTWNERESIEKLVSEIRNVLQGIPLEIIIVDDSSPDGTFQIAKQVADVAITKKREGQTNGLLHGMQLARYAYVSTFALLASYIQPYHSPA